MNQIDDRAYRGGTKIGKKLNQAGVTRFVQIAELSDEAITQLERDVVRFNGRIKRDDWPGQARRFYWMSDQVNSFGR